MALEGNTWVLAVAGASWLLSVFLLFKLWRRPDYLGIKLGLSLILVAPIVGPLFYFWIQAFPVSNHPDLMDHRGFGADFLARWRSRLEQSGKLPPMVQHWRKGRRK
jgi:hypothetical protein